ncbi:MAG: box helicase domain protein [Planctomycetaceae bacterium]|nr:box helicase domain protein [Planctomycetaceae bacterium]
MPEDPLLTPLQFLTGVGPKRAELLAKLGLHTAQDLLWYLPRDYLDLTDVRSVRDLESGKTQSVRGKVVDIDYRQLTGGRTLVAVLLECEGGYLRATWFNQVWMYKKFQPNENVVFSGKPKWSQGRWEIPNPEVQHIGEEDDVSSALSVLPRYGLTDGLKMAEMRRIAQAAVEQFVEFVTDPTPPAFRVKLQLPALSDALLKLHLPRNMHEAQAAKRCLVFHDLLDFQIALALRRRYWKRRSPAPVLQTTPKIDARIRRLFPFSLTAGQDAAILDIVNDLQSGSAMNRLLQADVGAGKTAIAIYGMLVAIAAGYQACLMAPTELLTVQHWQTVERLLSHSRVQRLLLTGGLGTKDRQAALEQIRSGTAQLVVGTQALIQKDVNFAKLGLVVVDEQHRFGVMQRAHFSSGAETVHMLVMTATPIPRSLCLTQFGDLDLSINGELPPGRQKIVTSRVSTAVNRAKAWDFIRQKVHSGRQVYVVCPRVEDSFESFSDGLASAEAMYRRLQEDELQGVHIGLVHGQMDRDLKAQQMAEFRAGKIQVLVSTTVIEVGVDVPNANIMVIFQAERFGLSQLHQLRGRIGRGDFQGYCFLFTETDKADAMQRLLALETSTNGFEIAEADFKLRGPGDVLGTRQHGDLPLKVADLVRDEAVLKEARAAAFTLVDSGVLDQPDYAMLKIRVLDRFEKPMELSRSG